MRRRLFRFGVVLSTFVVIIVGGITSLGLLLGNPSMSTGIFKDVLGGLDTLVVPTGEFAGFFVQLAVVTVALTIIIGVLNLLYVHFHRVVQGRTIDAKLTSITVLLSFAIALVAYNLNRDLSTFLLENVQVTIESALASLLFFTLVYGAFRMLKDRVTLARFLFIFSALVVLIGSLPFAEANPFRQFTNWMLTVPANAGTRGILLGIALATIVTGLRVLIGQDRSYGE